MAARTLVVALGPREQDRLEQRLRQGDFVQKSVDHARFSARGEGVVATLYRSGKLVVQGEGVDLFAARYLEGVALAAASAETVPGAAPADHAMIGSDEAGKGDFFGPLVVAAVRIGPGDREALRASGAMDSKRMSDERVLRLSPALQARFPHAIERLDPPEYNRAHQRVRNLNPMLATLHARAIRRLAEPGIDVLVDRFAREDLLRGMLADCDVRLRQTPRAESEMAVAAASVIARGVFLERLALLSEEYGVDLHKGAGPPTDAAARRFLALHGFERLGEVAKLHFKTVAKLGPRP
jgi:ribonuclease HIII